MTLPRSLQFSFKSLKPILQGLSNQCFLFACITRCPPMQPIDEEDLTYGLFVITGREWE